MANDLDLAIPRSMYHYVASHKLHVLRTYNHDDMLIDSIILAINNDFDSAAPRSSLHLIVRLLRHVWGL